MDYFRLGAAALVAAAFAAALVVRDGPETSVVQAEVRELCLGAHTGHSDQSMREHIDAMAASADVAHAALIQTMEPMHSDMMAGITAQEFDTAFVCGMVPHHQGAIEMARVAIAHGSDPWVKMFAQHVIQEQEAEIKEMRGWLAQHRPTPTVANLLVSRRMGHRCLSLCRTQTRLRVLTMVLP